jgi:5-hydroxyisourate hydrolase-like protein (transthyretin family)
MFIQKKTVIGMMLATTVALGALAGCATPAQTTMPGTQQAAAKQQAGAQTSQTTAQAMAEEREMEHYGYLADEAEPAGYNVMMVGQPKPKDGEMAITAETTVDAGKGAKAETKAEATNGGKARVDFKGKLKAEVKAKLDTRKAKLKAKAKGQLDKMKNEKDAIGKAAKAAQWVDNGDGTETKAMSFSVEKTVNGQTSSRSVKMERTRKTDDKTLVSAHSEFSTSHNGVTRTVVRDKALQEDGSYKVTFHSEMTFKDGSKRVADWNKTISADGAVSGTGTIVWTGKMTKTVTIKFGGTEEAETATAADPTTGTTSNVTTTVEGGATAEVTDPATGATTNVTVDANADAVVATEPTASPAPAASASPEASASPAASASASTETAAAAQ